MPRQARIDIPGELYHIIARGMERRRIFCDARDRQSFVERLGALVRDCKIRCFAWALLPNHFHLLLMPTETPVSRFMQRLLGGYAVTFNLRHKRSGHLFQNRYKAILCQKENYFLELIRYIHLNPLRAGVVHDIDALERYPWCGHGVLVGKNRQSWQDIEEVLLRFSKRKTIAVEKYREFTGVTKENEAEMCFLGGGLRRSMHGGLIAKPAGSGAYWQGDERVLGDGEFIAQVINTMSKQEERNDLKSRGWDLERLTREVCGALEVPLEDIRQRGRMDAVSKSRSLIAYLGYQELGLSVTEIARYLGISKSSASESVQRGRRMAKIIGDVVR